MPISTARFERLVATVGLSLVLTMNTALAEIPNNLSDIVYQSTDWGSRQLRARGYTLVHSDHHGGKTFEYWWNGSSNACIQGRAASGKYESLSVAPGPDCGQYHEEAISGSDAAAVLVAAAAIAGVAALAHNSHQRDGKHGDDEKSVAEFERGYRDGLHHERYHNRNDTQAYSDGYTAGQTERDEETRHRAHEGRHSGYQRYVSLDDLVGAKASSADSALRSRGFSDTGGYKQNDKSFVTWYNASTHQCVQSVTRDGRIQSLEAIGEGNCQ